jgi:lysophospholipase L1-like esterase
VSSIPRPGRRFLQVVARTGFGAGTVMSVAAAGLGVLMGEAKLARRTIGEPTEKAPAASGTYGRGPRGEPVVRMALLGDSSAAGLGVLTSEETTGAMLAGGLSRELGRRVRLDVRAAIGARSADLDKQVVRALRHRVDLAVIMIGANDVTHRVRPGDAARDLARAVRTLRAAGTVVVVGTCPDLGTVEPLLQPLRAVARVWSRKLAQAQLVAVVEADGLAVSLGNLLGPEFAQHKQYWSPDRFHPSSAGYARVVDVLLPTMLRALGAEAPGAEAVPASVQDIDVAASVAASTPGLEVEAIPGGEGAASAGPGRLARLVRRVPLVGRGEPAPRTPEEDLPEDEPAAER